jgi:hypothetical protein
VSELEDQFKEMIRGLPFDAQYRDEHLKKVRSQAMSEFDNAGRATTGFSRSRFRFARRHAIGGAVAALLLASVGLGVVVYLGRSRQAEPWRRPTMAKPELAQVEMQLVASLQAVEDSSSDHNTAAHDRAVDACLTWHLIRVAGGP